MIQYFDNGDLACFDGLSFRRDKKTGYFLNAKTHKRLHVYVWEYYNGKIKKGYHIHHKDKNKNNNEIENLEMLSPQEHQKIHAIFDEERKEKARKNLIENAVPKSKEWHKSEQGKQWHSQHAVDYWKNAEMKKYICTFCGCEFETKNTYSEKSNHFCSNNCKSAYRRKMGFDNVVKICEKCGCEYTANKYQKTRYCQKCKGSKNRKTIK